MSQCPGPRRNARAKVFCQLFGPFERPIKDADIRPTILQETVNDGARRSAGAEHDDGAGIIPPVRCPMFEIGHQAVGVGIGACQLVIFKPERVCRPDGDGRGLSFRSGGKRRFLVRHRNIAAFEAARPKRT